jgi:hypothetical protein
MVIDGLRGGSELDLVRATLQDVVRALEEGQLTSEILVQRYLGECGSRDDMCGRSSSLQPGSKRTISMALA